VEILVRLDDVTDAHVFNMPEDKTACVSSHGVDMGMQRAATYPHSREQSRMALCCAVLRHLLTIRSLLMAGSCFCTYADTRSQTMIMFLRIVDESYMNQYQRCGLNGIYGSKKWGGNG
jgi:hypothetical protein